MNAVDSIDGVSTRSGSKPTSPSLPIASSSPSPISVPPAAASQFAMTDEEPPIHVTRRRTNSLIKRPRHLDSPSPTPPPPSLSSSSVPHPQPQVAKLILTTGSLSSSASPSSTPTPNSTTTSTTSTTTPRRPSLQLHLNSSKSSSPPPTSASSVPPPPPPLSITLGRTASSHHSRPSLSVQSSTSMSPAASAVGPEAYDFSSSDRRHPRDYVPYEIGFPTKEMEDKVHKDDKEDRLLMATCAVLLAHENRALCPKEVAEVMEERGWLRNAGTTPFAHISTCIRAHLRRAATSFPPYTPIIRQYDLSGSLQISDVRAVGLRAEERPAVKRGTLWFLDERVFGPGLGVEDPFVRCRREAGLDPNLPADHPMRTVPLFILPPAVNFGTALPPRPPPVEVPQEEEDDTGMGRGKRKRRASSAAMAALNTDPTTSAFLSSAMATSLPNAFPFPTLPSHHNLPQRRANSFSAAGGLNKSLKLKLRLSSLAEVDSGLDDSEDGSDANGRRKTKKKQRRAASEGMSRGGSTELPTDDLDDVQNSHAFSSASSSALLQQSLLAASAPASSGNSRFAPAPVPLASTVVSPGSLQLATSPRPPIHHLSMSAPALGVGLFSSFSASSTPASPDPMAMEVDDHAGDDDSADDEEDFHEAMLRGDDFDFEWGSDTYAGSTPAPLIGRSKSNSFADWQVEGQGEPEDDANSTPATTPRSPPSASREDEEMTSQAESAPQVAEVEEQPFKMGMEATLCEAYRKREEGEGEESEEHEQAQETIEVVSRSLVKEEVTADTLGPSLNTFGDMGEIFSLLFISSSDRANSTESLTALVNAVPASEGEEVYLHQEDDEMVVPVEPTTSVPPPSPLSLELQPLLSLSRVFSDEEYDFVGYEEEDIDSRTHYRSKSAAAYDRELAESADDEDEDDDIVTVKIEDEGSAEAETLPSSRQSSVYPLESFARRLMVEQHLSSSSSSSSSSESGDAFDSHPMIVSSSLLASGLPVPQVAPSPPETTDWGMHLDLDDIDLELGSGVDLLGPESVGLEELDLAWSGSPEQGEDETEEEWRSRQEDRAALARSLAVGPTFLTGVQERFSSPVSSRSIATSSPRSSAATLVNLDTTTDSKAPSLARRLSSASAKASPAPASSNPIVVYPTTPLNPTVTATIVQRGVAVFATSVTDRATGSSVPLIRRIDTDYINGSVLLQGALNLTEEREAILAEFSETFKVYSGGAGLEGTWIPLPAARVLSARYSSYLSPLNIFLDEELGMRFPDPIPTMRSALRQQLANSPPQAVTLGFPEFADAQSDQRRSSSPAVIVAPTSSISKRATPAKGRPTRLSKGVISSDDEVTPTAKPTPVRKTRRRSSVATTTK